MEINAVEQTTKVFKDATVYYQGEMGMGVRPIVCKSVTITTGVKYAQYNDAIRVQFLEKGKRKERAFMLTYRPWLRIVATKDAISPDASLVPVSANASVSVSRSRYMSCDPRWQTDFENKLAETGITVLYEIGAGDREGELIERYLKLDETRVA